MTLVKLILPWEFCLKKITKKLIRMDKKIFDMYSLRRISLTDLQNMYVHSFGERVRTLITENNIQFEAEELVDIQVNRELVELIGNCSEKHLYIWSSNTRPIISEILTKLKLIHKFEKIVTREDVSLLKPNPEGFTIINKDIYTSLNHFLLIGNSSNDSQAAKAAKIDFLLIDHFKS